MTEAPPAEPEAPPPAEPSVESYGDWKLVTSGNWQVSISPDGLLMLPRHLHPRDWADFVNAGNVAARLGAEMIAENIEKAKNDDRRPAPARAIVTESGTPPPAGTLPMLITPGPNPPPQATIGRRNARRAPTRRPTAAEQ